MTVHFAWKNTHKYFFQNTGATLATPVQNCSKVCTYGVWKYQYSHMVIVLDSAEYKNG